MGLCWLIDNETFQIGECKDFLTIILPHYKVKMKSALFASYFREDISSAYKQNCPWNEVAPQSFYWWEQTHHARGKV